jgi:hypothetical protein
MSAFLKALVAALISGVASALLAWRDKAKADKDAEAVAVGDAATETQQVITGVADARSQLTPAGSAGDLAARLRARAAAEGGDSGSGENGKSSG